MRALPDAAATVLVEDVPTAPRPIPDTANARDDDSDGDDVDG